MTITSTDTLPNKIVGNVDRIEDADVVLLLEKHDSKNDFAKIEKILKKFYQDTNDLVLLEHPKTSRKQNLLAQEEKLGLCYQEEHLRLWRVEVLQDKNIAGWDHTLSETWVKEYYLNPDVHDFRSAVKVLETLSQTTSTEKVESSFRTLVRGLRQLKKDDTLLPDTEYKPLIKKRDFESKRFIALKDQLIECGEEVLLRMKRIFTKKAFPLRQEALISSLKAQTPSIKKKSGRIYVIMGENHGNPFTSDAPAEVQKVINYLDDKHHFIIY